ncbi:peroxidase [Lindgomyces ingoldianus]|uniref:Peroxidase n=1 Tax=Lindgomyces ingoldianus TaxID=673940 RepID=A0ACB6R2L7_9PLEO|nr:peroxidase [Lindgomyces ingoldianus]KAF2473297.1 peroxidase [Lindgomyces ingoldianus]
MKISILTLGFGLLTFIDSTLAYPGIRNTIREIEKRVAQTPPDGNNDGSTPPVLIGDLKNGIRTPVGQTIANILLKTESGQSSEAGYTPPIIGSKKCKQDTCCVWWYVSQALTIIFKGPSGRCNKNARAAVRLGFHDAGTWSQPLADSGSDFGGADGSIALSSDEINRGENNGLQDIIGKMKIIKATFGVGMGDLIQFAGIHATVTCPLGPRIRFFAGRKDSSKSAPNNLLPGVNDSADKLIQLFQDKTIAPHDLVALLGAHTTSQQFFVDPKRKGEPQDGTPGIWDTLFYNQTMGTGPLPKKVFRFASDIVISQDSRTKSEWVQFAGPGGQSHWNDDYAHSYIRLSMLGVNNMNSMTECTKVLPAAQSTFKGAGELLVEE